MAVLRSKSTETLRRGHATHPQPVLFIQGAGSMHEPEGSGRLAAYLARELSTGYGVLAPEMPDADNPHSTLRVALFRDPCRVTPVGAIRATSSAP